MKRIIILVITASLVYLAVNRCQVYYRYNPGKDYNYKISDKVDANYHDSKIVEEYYRLGYEIGSFARTAWINEGIDVLYPNKSDSLSINASKHYENMKKRAKMIERKLLQSTALKKEGYGNEDIKFIEKSGIERKQVDMFKAIRRKNVQMGDTGKYVWDIQKLLIHKGFDIELDGKFIGITEKAVKTFQKKHQIFPTGVVDERTLRILLKEKQKKK